MNIFLFLISSYTTGFCDRHTCNSGYHFCHLDYTHSYFGSYCFLHSICHSIC